MLVFFIILIILILIYLSGIKIQIENIEIERNNKFNIREFKINIYIMLFNKIKVIKIPINKEKIEKINFHPIIDKFKEKSIKQDKNFVIKNLERLEIKTESLNIKADLGLNNLILLSYITTLINIAFSMIFVKISNGDRKNYKYIIKPLQTNSFYLKISINCIISIKMANIINMIIKNRSEEKYERTSNRGFNGNCHEQYTRYGRCKYHYRGTN